VKAFLMAAGYGNRLRPLTDETPKPLVQVAGYPLMTWALAMLREAGIDEVICNLHYRGEQVVDYLERNNCFGFTFHFSHEEEILGTGGGLYKCLDHLDGETLVINSDIITDLDVAPLLEKRDTCRVALSPAARERATVSVKGDRVVDFRGVLESGIPPYHDYMGIAFLTRDIYPFLVPEFSSIVYTGYTELAKRGRLSFHEHRGLWLDAGTPESIRRAERILAGRPELLDRVSTVLGKVR
jgi:mannose-1-phosphate guanylyltransferase